MKHIENARITDVHLGIEDHGILSLCVYCEGAGWGQAYGHFGVGKMPNLGAAIKKLLESVGCDNLCALKGKLVRVEREDGEFRAITAIGHILDEKWFDMRTFFREGR